MFLVPLQRSFQLVHTQQLEVHLSAVC
jgi:hypothetical protein